jgi:hypothetical protein
MCRSLNFAGMSTTARIVPDLAAEVPDLAAEVLALKRLMSKLLKIAERDPEGSQTIPQFCASEAISRAFYYDLKKVGRGPREMRHGDGCVRISAEARRDWRLEREAETMNSERGMVAPHGATVL